jgi:hypothetical protein
MMRMVDVMSTKGTDVTAYKHLVREEEIRVQTSACAMSRRLDALLGHVQANGKEDTEYDKRFAEGLATAQAIRDEVTADWKSRYVYAPERYSTVRARVDEGMRLLDAEPGFEGLEKMKACVKECQEKMDEYAEVCRKILEFDSTHTNPYMLWRRVYGIHAFSNEKKTDHTQIVAGGQPGRMLPAFDADAKAEMRAMRGLLAEMGALG